MPRYFFHVHDDQDCPDPEGTELPDLAAARAEAVRSGRSIIAEQIRRGHGPVVMDHRIDIADDRGSILAAIPFSEMLEIEWSSQAPG